MDATVVIVLSLTILVLAIALVIVVTSWAGSLREPVKVRDAIDRIKAGTEKMKAAIARDTPK